MLELVSPTLHKIVDLLKQKKVLRCELGEDGIFDYYLDGFGVVSVAHMLFLRRHNVVLIDKDKSKFSKVFFVYNKYHDLRGV